MECLYCQNGAILRSVGLLRCDFSVRQCLSIDVERLRMVAGSGAEDGPHSTLSKAPAPWRKCAPLPKDIPVEYS